MARPNTLDELIERYERGERDFSGLVLAAVSLDAPRPQARLAGAVLRGADLSEGGAFEGADLRGADLQGADLRGVDLRGADLRGCSLIKAQLEGADLRRARLDGARVHSAELAEARLEGACLDGADFGAANLSCAKLQGARARNAHLDLAEAEFADFRGVDLSGATLGGSWVGADLRCARLLGAQLDDVCLREACLDGAWLGRAHIRDAQFDDATLVATDLRDCWVVDSSFELARISGAHLEGAQLRGVGLGAKFFDMDLLGLDLSHNDLSGAVLTRVAFSAILLHRAGAGITLIEVSGRSFSGISYADQPRLDARTAARATEARREHWSWQAGERSPRGPIAEGSAEPHQVEEFPLLQRIRDGTCPPRSRASLLFQALAAPESSLDPAICALELPWSVVARLAEACQRRLDEPAAGEHWPPPPERFPRPNPEAPFCSDELAELESYGLESAIRDMIGRGSLPLDLSLIDDEVRYLFGDSLRVELDDEEFVWQLRAGCSIETAISMLRTLDLGPETLARLRDACTRNVDARAIAQSQSTRSPHDPTPRPPRAPLPPPSLSAKLTKRRTRLEAKLRANMHDERGWEVYADFLMELGDPRGRSIVDARAHQKPSPALPAPLGLCAHERAPPLPHCLVGAPIDLAWFRGFIVQATIHDHGPSTTAMLLELSEAALLHTLSYTNLRHELSPALAALLARSSVPRIELLWPQREDVLLHHGSSWSEVRELLLVTGTPPFFRPPALGLLPALERLELRLRETPDFERLLAGSFPALRALELRCLLPSPPIGTLFVAQLDSLEQLSLERVQLGPLGPLARLVHLRELSLLETPLLELEALLELPKLERLEITRGLGEDQSTLTRLSERGVQVFERPAIGSRDPDGRRS